jgi:hypothetical protein
MLHIEERSEEVVPEAVVSWLQGLLREQIGLPLLLQHSIADGWLLRLEGAAGRLRFSPLISHFYATGNSPPCATWDSAAERFGVPEADRLPAPGIPRLEHPLISWSTEGLDVAYDIPGMVLWVLSRAEEIERPERDGYGRFPVEASHAFRHSYLDRPIVDEWLLVLRNIVSAAWPGAQPRYGDFATMPSHDVDEPSRYAFRTLRGLLRAMVGDLTRNVARLDALRAPWIRARSGKRLHSRDPYNTFDWLMEASERRGLRSSFFFMSGSTGDPLDADYDLGHPAMRCLMREVHRRGHEIGLHPSFRSLEHRGRIASEAELLRRIAAQEHIAQDRWGSRMHYLRIQVPQTLYDCARAGMSYDSTLGYGGRPGFRCGTCRDYQAFDPVRGRAIDLRIRPLVVMESSVVAPRYMGLGTSAAAYDEFLRVKRACRRVGGNFTLLWHNSELRSEDHRALYLSVLDG